MDNQNAKSNIGIILIILLICLFSIAVVVLYTILFFQMIPKKSTAVQAEVGNAYDKKDIDDNGTENNIIDNIIVDNNAVDIANEVNSSEKDTVTLTKNVILNNVKHNVSLSCKYKISTDEGYDIVHLNLDYSLLIDNKSYDIIPEAETETYLENDFLTDFCNISKIIGSNGKEYLLISTHVYTIHPDPYTNIYILDDNYNLIGTINYSEMSTFSIEDIQVSIDISDTSIITYKWYDTKQTTLAKYMYQIVNNELVCILITTYGPGEFDAAGHI